MSNKTQGWVGYNEIYCDCIITRVNGIMNEAFLPLKQNRAALLLSLCQNIDMDSFLILYWLTPPPLLPSFGF